MSTYSVHNESEKARIVRMWVQDCTGPDPDSPVWEGEEYVVIPYRLNQGFWAAPHFVHSNARRY